VVAGSGPAWSPDGLWILVMRESFADGPGDPLGLHLIDPGSSRTNVITGTNAATGWAWRPSSSPSTAP